MFTIEAALAPDAPLVNDGDDNLFQHTTVRKGDIAEGFAQADVIIEQTYRTQSMDHVPMEPEAGLAYVDSMGVLNIITATQYPFRDRRQIAPNVGLPMNRVRVIQAPVGGGFGRKDDITTEIHAGLLALKTGRPVRLVYTREESLFALTKRHPFTIHYKSGARADGQLTAVEASIYGDSGPVRLARDVCDQEGRHSRHRAVLRPQREGGHLHRHHEQPHRRRDARIRRAAGRRRARIADGHARARARHVAARSSG